jgi:NADPH2:quinone reductase
VVGVVWGAYVQREPAAFGRQVAALTDLYLAGSIRPKISARFPLERAGEAIRLIGERRALGKIVVTIGGD